MEGERKRETEREREREREVQERDVHGSSFNVDGMVANVVILLQVTDTCSKHTGAKHTGAKHTGAKHTGVKHTGVRHTCSKHTGVHILKTISLTYSPPIHPYPPRHGWRY